MLFNFILKTRNKFFIKNPDKKADGEMKNAKSVSLYANMIIK